MNLTQALILAVVEGVTEFMPISSTGHMILVSQLFGIAQDSFTKSFEITVQLGAILAVAILYAKKIYSSRHLFRKIALAFLPTAIVGFLGYKILKNYLLGSVAVVLWSFLIGGVLLVAFELWYTRNLRQTKELDNQKAFWTGLAQALAIIPGISRSGATIMAGLLMGVSRQEIVEFSFLLAIPTMLAATGYDLFKSAGEFSFSQWHLLMAGFATSFVVALLSIKWFLGYIKNHSFIGFGIYRIIFFIIFAFFIFK